MDIPARKVGKLASGDTVVLATSAFGPPDAKEK
jgi:hypothetical protein